MGVLYRLVMMHNCVCEVCYYFVFVVIFSPPIHLGPIAILRSEIGADVHSGK